MRILVLNFEYPPLGGGASPIGRELSERFVKSGHTVDVVTMHHPTLAKVEFFGGVNIYRVGSWRQKINISTPLEQLMFLRNAKQVIRDLMAKETYDICHCHFLIPTGLLALWVKRTYEIPYIVTIHGSDVPGYNPDRFQFLHLFTKPFIQQVIANAMAIVSPSVYLMDLLREKVWVEALQTRRLIIEYGITQNLVESKKQNIILSTGRLLERKGFKDLILAVSEKDIGYEVHICGDGPEMSVLQNLAKKSATKIVLHGWLNSDTQVYKDLLSEAKIFVLVSSHENSSVSLMEAMANHCAVITSDGTGCLEMIQDVGLCVPCHDVAAIKNAIDALIRDEGKMWQLGRLAFNKSREKYNWEIITAKYLKLMEESILRFKKTLEE
ncbi:MAG TPA: glycosyltransferase family 4 protein [Saprospiraceae bacterium]|nr:glycosyltransferase family 4 protein [Saprospiraceae bacterium]